MQIGCIDPSIIVFGLMPSGSSPPRASYVIDDLPLKSPVPATTTECLSNMQFFKSDTLVHTGRPHNLTISVMQASVDQPYILDHLWLCKPNTIALNTTSKGPGSWYGTGNGTGNGIWTGPSGNPSGNSTENWNSTSAKDMAIISLASVFLLTIVFALGVYIYIRLRATQKTQQPPESFSSKGSDY